MLDHGHLGQPGGQLPDVVLGCGRRQLHDRLRGRLGRVAPGGAVDLGVVDLGHLRRLRRRPSRPSYSGFVNGDSPSSLTSPPACSTTATSSSPVGTYPSSCSGAADPNYTISYVSGTVQVTTAPLVIAASSPSMTYGSHGPDHHAVVLGLRERRQRLVADHRADLLHGGDVVEPGGELPRLVLAGLGPELRHHLRPRDDGGGERSACDHGRRRAR